ncbi:protein kinase domain-containing protein [Endozoicomonas numazuensis]|uniref:non-specific serine/threonine protein kinase n=1 Tax=Endozoicomonas numazuensis TaxID=1137799 RepID=A0A081NIV3_9GAMM|nr:protein kinase [Endozoicomonas numazuensis]KEQ18376.1 hypothetical protein GZ78_12800 [Endozoicomonas numazuensis]
MLASEISSSKDSISPLSVSRLSAASGVSSGSNDSSGLILGRGGCGRAILKIDPETRQLLVEKRAHNDTLLGPRYMQVLKREAEALGHLSHPNIINKLGHTGDARWCESIILEFGGVDLGRWSKLNSSHEDAALLSRKKKQKLLLKQVVEGLKYLHDQNLIHRDIKPQNILVDAQLRARICDFGELMELTEENIFHQAGDTPEYRSPDQWTGAGWSPASDMWSFGCVMYHVLTGKDILPELANKTQFPMTLYLEEDDGVQAYYFEDKNELLGWIDFEIVRKVMGNVTDPQAKTLLLNLLSIDPGKRPPAGYLKAHPWFNVDRPEIQNYLP